MKKKVSKYLKFPLFLFGSGSHLSIHANDVTFNSSIIFVTKRKDSSIYSFTDRYVEKTVVNCFLFTAISKKRFYKILFVTIFD
jgi:hypothetical protein